MAAAMLLAACFAVLTPTLFIPDEAAHYLRAYEVSRLHLVNTPEMNGITMPCEEYLDVVLNPAGERRVSRLDDVRDRLDDPGCRASTLNSANIYPALAYALPAIAFAGAELLGVSDARTKLVAGRVFNALLCCLIAFAGIRLSAANLGVVAVAFTPAVLSQMGSLSADALQFALALRLSFLLVEVIFEGRRTPWVEITLICAGLVLTKSTGVIFALVGPALLLLGPERRTRSDLVGALGVLGLAVIVALAARSSVPPPLGNRADPPAQVVHVLTHLASTIRATLATISAEAWPWVQQLSRPVHQATRLVLGPIVAVSCLLAMVLGARRPVGAVRWGMGGVAALFAAAAFGAMYLAYTPVGHTSILGVQGRYFLPSLMLMAVALYGAAGLHLPRLRLAATMVPALVSAFVLLDLAEAPAWRMGAL